jgi:hypothetical protein
MGVAKSMRLGSWACDTGRSGLINGGGEEEGIDVWSSASVSVSFEGWLVGVTSLLWYGAGANLDAGRSVRVELWAREERIWSLDNGRSVCFVLTLYIATFRRSRSASAFYLLSALGAYNIIRQESLAISVPLLLLLGRLPVVLLMKLCSALGVQQARGRPAR